MNEATAGQHPQGGCLKRLIGFVQPAGQRGVGFAGESHARVEAPVALIDAADFVAVRIGDLLEGMVTYTRRDMGDEVLGKWKVIRSVE